MFLVGLVCTVYVHWLWSAHFECCWLRPYHSLTKWFPTFWQQGTSYIITVDQFTSLWFIIMAAIQINFGYGKHNSADAVGSCWKQNLARRWMQVTKSWSIAGKSSSCTSASKHNRSRTPSTLDSLDQTKMLGFVSVCVCVLTGADKKINACRVHMCIEWI
jgi:hypothetical protein